MTDEKKPKLPFNGMYTQPKKTTPQPPKPPKFNNKGFGGQTQIRKSGRGR